MIHGKKKIQALTKSWAHTQLLVNGVLLEKVMYELLRHSLPKSLSYTEGLNLEPCVAKQSIVHFLLLFS